MAQRVIHLLVLILLIGWSTGDNEDKHTKNLLGSVTNILHADDDESVTALDEALSALANLTNTQKLVWDQQRAYEEALLIRHKEEEARQAARSTALEEEHNYLRSIWGTFSRKLKRLTRRSKNINEGTQSINTRPKDCADLYLEGEEVSGVYQIWPTWNQSSFSVYCDMETDGGGWTVIHRWGNYSFPNDFFNREFQEYKTGFGNLETTFWLGNYLIYLITSQGSYELRFDFDGHPKSTFSQYRGFWIERETQNFKAHVDSYIRNGNAGDIFRSSNGSSFSTFDRTSYYCNSRRRGWWFQEGSCSVPSMFNLVYVPSTNEEHNVFKKEMKIRPAQFKKLTETS